MNDEFTPRPNQPETLDPTISKLVAKAWGKYKGEKNWLAPPAATPWAKNEILRARPDSISQEKWEEAVNEFFSY
jgi:hypothetical protein